MLKRDLGLMKNLVTTKKNQKGFSLVELLIVIAIMGVLAVIAFNAFSGVLTSSKRDADAQQAKNIERAVRTLTASTAILDLTSTRFKKDSGGNNSTTIANDTGTVGAGNTPPSNGSKVLNLLVSGVYVQDPLSGSYRKFGPYLDSSFSGDNAWKQFNPQWNPDNGGENLGWKIEIKKGEGSIKVTSVTGSTIDVAKDYNFLSVTP